MGERAGAGRDARARRAHRRTSDRASSTAIRRASLIARRAARRSTLDVVVPLASSAGTESMTLPGPGSALSAVTLVVPRTGVDLSRLRRLHRGAVARRRTTAAGSSTGTPAGRSRSRGSARPTIADRRCRCGRVRASRSSSRSARTRRRSRRACSVEVSQGLARQTRRRAAGRARRQPGRRRHRRRLERRRRHADRHASSSRSPRRPRSSSAARCARRAKDRSRFRSSACRRRSVRPAASPSMSSAPGRSPTASRAASSRPTRRTSATSSPAASRRRWSRSSSRRSGERAALADRERVALHAAGGARRQRRGSALRRAPRRGRQAAGPRALRRPQQPAQLPRGHAAAAVGAVERVARGPADPSRRAADGGLLLPLAKGAPNEEAPTFVVELLYLQRGQAGRRRATRTSSCPPSICRLAHRPDAASLAALRGRSPTGRVPVTSGSGSVERLGRSPNPSRRHRRRPRTGGAASSRRSGRQGSAGAHGSLPEGSRPNPAGRDSHRHRFSRVGPSVFLAAELTPEHAVAVGGHRLSQDGRPLMTCFNRCVRVAALVLTPAAVAAQDASRPPGPPAP